VRALGSTALLDQAGDAADLEGAAQHALGGRLPAAARALLFSAAALALWLALRGAPERFVEPRERFALPGWPAAAPSCSWLCSSPSRPPRRRPGPTEEHRRQKASSTLDWKITPFAPT
jgi:hypothetical protein